MNYAIRWLFFVVTLFSTSTGICQFSDLKEATDLHYGEMDSPFTWEKQMVGKLDEVFEIYLFLVTDTKKYQGVYQIGDSKDLRYLEGEYDGIIITLFEYDEEGNLTGVIRGDLNDYIFYGNRTDRKNTEEVSFVVYSSNYKLHEDIASNWIKSFQDKDNYIHIEKCNDSYLVKCDINGVIINASLECLEDDQKKYRLREFSEEAEETSVLQLEIVELELRVNYRDSIKLSLPLTNIIRHQNKNNSLGNSNSYEVSPYFEHPKLKKAWNKFITENIGKLKMRNASEEIESSLDIIPDYLSATQYSGFIRYQDNLSSNLKEIGFLIDLNKNKVQTLSSFFPKGYDLSSEISLAFEKLEKTEESSETPKLGEFDVYSVDKNNLIVRSRMSLIYGQTILYIPLKSLPFKIIK